MVLGDAELVRLTARGPLGREIVRRIVARRLNELRYCQRRERARGRPTKGKIAISFTIEPDGSADSVETTGSTTTNTNLEACVEQAPTRWRFPQAKNTTAVGLETSFSGLH
ncbi:MAG: AgmX/PglI C-terminal domain-containing protein [Polyangia bacterium]